MFRLPVLILLFTSHFACAQAAPATEPATKPGPANAATQQASIKLFLQPWGEVFVDGKSRGVSPPLKSIKVAPGEHVVVIKKAGEKPFEMTIYSKAGEETTIKHVFAK